MPAPPIAPDVLRLDDDGVTLLGGWSPTSRLRHFPIAPVCPFTGADDVEPVDLPRQGHLWLWTEVTAPPPGYTGPVPYGLGVVVLDGEPPLRVLGRVHGGRHLELGCRVELFGEELPGPDGEPATTWAFRPVGAG